jgi:hypothetical protein
MIMDDFEFEPVRGLPQRLPEGEKLLWQGAPDWRKLAKSVFHVKIIAAYFAALLGWGVLSALSDGFGVKGAAQPFLWLIPLAVVAVGILTLMAWLTAKTTVYSITSKRVVMRIGIALPITFNIPFKIIGTAGLRVDSDGFGDIPLSLSTTDKLAYLILWPHARPWRLAKPEPMLRAIPHASGVAAVLADALAAELDPAVRRRLVPGLKVYSGSLALGSEPRIRIDALSEKAS